jgi:hypothetical protein
VRVIAIVAAITVLLLPAWLAFDGWLRGRRDPIATAQAPGWRAVLASALAFTLAFNLQFFIQELFLVLPKALTPGLRPTLFHNNHAWEGQNPLAELFQGTGALATLIAAGLCAVFISRARTSGTRVLLIWMSYCGSIMALAQVVIGAINPRSDVGRAMTWLALEPDARLVAALLALALMPAISWWLLRKLLSLAGPAGSLTNASSRIRFVFSWATLPAMLAFAFIVPFRVPREMSEVLIVPALVILCGIPWMQAGAVRAAPDDRNTVDQDRLPWLAGATVALLATFHFVLRPGINFY